MAYRPATGRRITVEHTPKSVRALMRRHLREEGKRLIDLCPVWDMHENSLYRLFYKKSRPMAPQHVDAFIEFMKLDEFDAQDLRLQGAKEAGWRIDKRFLIERAGA